PPPQSGRHQHLPQRLLAPLHSIVLRQVFARQRGPKVVVLRLDQLQHLGAHTLRQAPIRFPPPQPVHDPSVAFLLHPHQQLPHPAVRHPQTHTTPQNSRRHEQPPPSRQASPST